MEALRLARIFAITCTLSACATFGSTTKVTVGRNSFSVAQMTNSRNTWAALALQGNGLLGNARLIGATKAIERVSGCKVIPETVTHQGAMTMAAVTCSK